MRKKEDTTVILEDNAAVDEKKFPLTQSEIEHNAYLALCKKYDEYKMKRVRYRKYGVIAIALSALVFLALMFSLESKVLFLIFWIITVVSSIVMMIRADYLCDMYSEMLGISDEKDDEEEEREGEQ